MDGQWADGRGTDVDGLGTDVDGRGRTWTWNGRGRTWTDGTDVDGRTWTWTDGVFGQPLGEVPGPPPFHPHTLEYARTDRPRGSKREFES